MTKSSKASAIIRYDGPAFENHRIPLEDLTAAMLGIAQMVKVANNTLNQGKAKVNIEVGLDQEQQCVQFIVDILQTLPMQLDAIVTGTSVCSAEDMLKHVGLIPSDHMGMMGLFKWLGKHSLEIAKNGLSKKDNKDGSTTVQTGDIHLTVNGDIYLSCSDSQAFKGIKQAVKGLPTNSPNFLLSGPNNENIKEIMSSDDVKGLQKVPSLDGIQEQASESYLVRTIVKARILDLLEDTQWSVIYGEHGTIKVTIEDKEWLHNKFQNPENPMKISTGTLLDVDMRVETLRDNQGMVKGKPSYCITKVYKMIPPADQITGELYN